jgi:hypothetical protein
MELKVVPLQQRQEVGEWEHEPSQGMRVKKMNSLGHKSLSGMALHHTLPSCPDDCDLSNHLSFMRLLPDLKREAGRMDAIAVVCGWDLEGGRELKNQVRRRRSLGARKQNEGA